MNIFHNIKRMYEMKFFRNYLLRKCIKRYQNRTTCNLIKKFKGKKILMVHASPYNHKMLKQRPHHFMDFWSKHFDGVLFWSILHDEPVLYKDNIYLVPSTPIEKFKDIDIYFYMSSVSCIEHKLFQKAKDFGYKIIYDYYDELSEDIASTKDSKKSHEKLAKINPQIILATSKRLYNDIKPHFSEKEIYLIENGVTVEDFMQTSDEIPADIVSIVNEGNPIVGYYGYIAPWIDLELIEKCLKERPNYNFIFIGKQHRGCNYNHLLKYSNFYFLGHKEYKELYKYSTRFNCAIIPFKPGNIAKATSPNKLFEFMAVGIPSVCTHDMDECRGYEGVFVSENDEAFIKDIDRALAAAKDETVITKLKEVALANTWKSKADAIYEVIKSLN